MADKLINAVNEFKKLGDETSIAIHGKQYFPVAPRIGTLRRVLGTSLSITTEIIFFRYNFIWFTPFVQKLINEMHFFLNKRNTTV